MGLVVVIVEAGKFKGLLGHLVRDVCLILTCQRVSHAKTEQDNLTNQHLKSKPHFQIPFTQEWKPDVSNA